MGGPDPYRHDRVSFKKRTHTLLDKGNQLASLLGAKVYLVIEHPRATIVYNSDESQEWPPPEKELDTKYPTLQRFSPTSKMFASKNRGKSMLECIRYRSKLLRRLKPLLKKNLRRSRAAMVKNSVVAQAKEPRLGKRRRSSRIGAGGSSFA